MAVGDRMSTINKNAQLPHLKAELKIVMAESGEIMEIPESAF